MGGESSPPCVFDDYDFIGRTFKFPQSGVWQLTELINASCHHLDIDFAFAESTGVFKCRAQDDTTHARRDTEAIMKIWSQHEPTTVTDAPYRPLKSRAHSELHWLKHLQRRGCDIMPQWFEACFQKQDAEMPFPGQGFVNCIVEQQLPGRSLVDFWDVYDPEQRERIRQLALSALSSMMMCGVYRSDKASRNLFYDEGNDRCYVIDFESCGELKQPRQAKQSDLRSYNLHEDCLLPLELRSDFEEKQRMGLYA